MNKVPEYRFSGYSDAWEQRKLGEISEKVKSKNINNELSNVLTNSAEYGIIPQRDFFDKDIANSKNLNGYYVVHPDDFVYNPRISNNAPVGPIKRNTLGLSGIMSPLYYVFRTFGIDNSYLAIYFDSTYWHKFMKLNGDSGVRSDRFAIKDSIFKEMPIPFPTLPEQTAIGDFFQTLDRSIALHQRKCDLFKERKKSLLQKMFPAKGQKIPEIRFPGFSGDWEEKKLGEVVKSVSSRNYISEYGEEGEYPVIQQGDIPIVGFSDNQPFREFLSTVLFGDHTLSLYKPTEPFLLATDGIKILSSKFMNQNFLFTALTQYMPESQGYKRHYTLLKEEKVSFPTLPEQEAIGSFFQTLDLQIQQQEERLQQLKETKQTLLKKLFV